VEAAHVRLGSGAGIGQKPSDYRCVSLCNACHRDQHSLGEETFWKRAEIITGQTIDGLIEAFCAASPKAREIREAKMEREYV